MLEAGTSHNLGQNFAKAFDTTFLDEKGQKQHVHQSSWGVSTRLIGGIIMTHGDDAGLRLPPALAPVQVVVVPIAQKNKDKETVAAAAADIVSSLTAAGVRVKLDDDTRNSPGWKFNHWEMKGVPVRIEVGPKDVAAGACVIARRDKPGKEGKEFGVSVEAASLVSKVNGVLDEVQARGGWSGAPIFCCIHPSHFLVRRHHSASAAFLFIYFLFTLTTAVRRCEPRLHVTFEKCCEGIDETKERETMHTTLRAGCAVSRGEGVQRREHRGRDQLRGAQGGGGGWEVGAGRVGGKRRDGEAGQGGDGRHHQMLPLRPTRGTPHVPHDGRPGGGGVHLRQVLLKKERKKGGEKRKRKKKKESDADLTGAGGAPTVNSMRRKAGLGRAGSSW